MRTSTFLSLLAVVFSLFEGCAETSLDRQDSVESSLKTGFVDAGETELYYEEMGRGSPLVMIHGGLLDRRMWDPQFGEFAEDYRAIRYDVRNHGDSLGVPGTFRHFDDLRKLLEQLDIDRAAIMGLSLGGRIAMDFAIAYPEKVGALILVSPGASGYEFKSEPFIRNNEQLEEAFRQGDIIKAVEYFQRSWTDGPGRAPTEVDPLVREKVREMAMSTVKGWNDESIVKELEPPAIGRLAEIHAPTLAVAGDLDMPGILEIVEAIQEDVVGAQVVVLSDVAHMVNLEKPEEFNRVVRAFLARTLR